MDFMKKGVTPYNRVSVDSVFDEFFRDKSFLMLSMEKEKNATTKMLCYAS